MKLFTILRNRFFGMKKIQSFKVSIKSRSTLVYEENGKTLNIEIEMLSGEHDFVVYFKDIVKWSSPPEQLLPEREKEVIRQRVTMDLERKNIKLDWD